MARVTVKPCGSSLLARPSWSYIKRRKHKQWTSPPRGSDRAPHQWLKWGARAQPLLKFEPPAIVWAPDWIYEVFLCPNNAKLVGCGMGFAPTWPVASPGFCVRGHRFGVVKKRRKIINVCRTTPGSTVYSWVCVIALGLCVIHMGHNNKMKIHDRPSFKKLPIPGINKSSADADKPARRVWRPVKVTKHGTFYILGMVSY